MRTTRFSVFIIPILLSTLTSALTLDCSHIRVDKKKFNFEKLGGPHSVTIIDEDRPPSIHNITYTVDICSKLKRDPDIPKQEQCPDGTYVCGIESTYNPIDDTKIGIESVIPIAGNYHVGGSGKGLEPKYARLKTADTEEEGLRMELHGGTFNKKDQMVIIEFQCDLTRSGNEGFETIEERRRKTKKNVEALADKDADDKDEEGEKSLTYVSYGSRDDKTDLLRLDWKTKYACEDYDDNDDEDGGSSKSSHWGLFTWFIIILFLGVAAYLIFGSWLNYNRYGARGWDLLPHGDTIRDIPYLFKDWSRKVVDTVQGGGSRGGYSAV